MKKVGIKRASTFTGFCSSHDYALFAPIEKEPLIISKQQAFLFAYRALCFELYAKKGVLGISDFLRQADAGRSEPEQRIVQAIANPLIEGTSIGNRDNEAAKKRYDKLLLSGDYGQVRYFAAWIDRVPDIMCTGGLFPEIDFKGEVLQDLADRSTILEYIGFAIVGTRNPAYPGLILFSWLDGERSSAQLGHSFERLSATEQPQAIVRFIFEFFENTFISPSWWGSLDSHYRNALVERFKTTIMIPYHNPKALLDDGNSYVDWKVVKTQTG